MRFQQHKNIYEPIEDLNVILDGFLIDDIDESKLNISVNYMDNELEDKSCAFQVPASFSSLKNEQIVTSTIISDLSNRCDRTLVINESYQHIKQGNTSTDSINPSIGLTNSTNDQLMLIDSQNPPILIPLYYEILTKSSNKKFIIHSYVSPTNFRNNVKYPIKFKKIKTKIKI